MIGWLLDTNVIAELISPKGERRVKEFAEGQDESLLYLSVITLAEYDKGIENLELDDPRRISISHARDALEARFADRLLSVSDRIVRRWGTLSGAVKRATGHAPSVIDTMLAATALEQGLYLVTRNIRDVRHSGAPIFDPWRDDPRAFPIRKLK
ncbi:MAG: VapC toxin family PIN domain ribonuclease [Methylocystaceae bacterium]|nr:MAG: VapC toxin family PIN domain ribonuclease [Methylocystaceae bacterium]